MSAPWKDLVAAESCDVDLHYGTTGLGGRILDALRATGKNLKALRRRTELSAAAGAVAGFAGACRLHRLAAWEDKTRESLNWYASVTECRRSGPPSPLGLHFLMGEDFGEKIGNLMCNLREHRLAVVQGIARR